MKALDAQLTRLKDSSRSATGRDCAEIYRADVWTGEFGRRSNINGYSPPGRDRWSRVYSTVFAGGGVQGGQVYGKSDSLAAEPVDHPVHVSNFVATIYHALGHFRETEVIDPFRRPHRVVAGESVLGLF